MNILFQRKKNYIVNESANTITSKLTASLSNEDADLYGKKGWGVEDDVFVFYPLLSLTFEVLGAPQRFTCITVKVVTESENIVVKTNSRANFFLVIIFYLLLSFVCYEITSPNEKPNLFTVLF